MHCGSLRCIPDSRLWRISVVALIPVLVAFLFPRESNAHPLGNFSVNHYSRLEVEAERVVLYYVMDMAEIPAFRARIQEIDEERDGTVSEDESERYLRGKIEEIRGNLRLSINGQELPLRVEASDLTFPEGNGGLSTLRLTARMVAPLPRGEAIWRGEYINDNGAGRIGWQEIVVRAGHGAELVSTSVPGEDVTDDLQEYPDHLLQAPLAVRQATFEVRALATAGGQNESIVASTAPPLVRRKEGGFEALIGSTEAAPGALLLAFLAAFGWGAAHALTPGHGKSIVAAYLVGSRGTVRHALFLGVTTTVTHTAGVFALGLLTLFLSRYLLPEQLFPWLGLLSGLLVVAIGCCLVRERASTRAGSVHEHAHDHSHHHGEEHDPAQAHEHGHHHGPGGHSHMPPGADSQAVTWRNLLALGVSGGLVPCPSALVVLLGAIALHRVGSGLLLVVAFSAGLATVLTALGIVLVRARALFDRLPASAVPLRLLPVASAAFIILAGLVMTWQALVQSGLLRHPILASAGLF